MLISVYNAFDANALSKHLVTCVMYVLLPCKGPWAFVKLLRQLFAQVSLQIVFSGK